MEAIPLCWLLNKPHLFSLTQHNTTQHNTARHGTTRHGTTRHGTVQHNTTQHNATRHGTARHGPAQHNTTQHNTPVLCYTNWSWYGTAVTLCRSAKQYLISKYKALWLQYIVQKQIRKYTIVQRTSHCVCELETSRYCFVKHVDVFCTLMTTRFGLKKTINRPPIHTVRPYNSSWTSIRGVYV